MTFLQTRITHNFTADGKGKYYMATVRGRWGLFMATTCAVVHSKSTHIESDFSIHLQFEFMRLFLRLLVPPPLILVGKYLSTIIEWYFWLEQGEEILYKLCHVLYVF